MAARVFKSKEFARFARKAALSDVELCRAIREVHAGTVDADLGGGVYKQRVRRSGGGKSGGFRTIILIRLQEIAIFVDGFSKSDRSNISKDELLAFRSIAKNLLFNSAAVAAATNDGKLIEVMCEGSETISQ